MAPLQDHQVEKLVEEAFKHNNFQDLEKYLQNEDKGTTSIKCSRQFMTKLDKLFIREMDLGNVDNACLVLTILHKYGERLVFPGGGGISVMVSQGFEKKWLEKAMKLWVEAGSSRNETMIKLAEDFFDALMVIQESCKEGTYEVTEALLRHVGKLASDAQINILIQKEAARKLNAILEKIRMELKKQIFSTQEALSMMNAVASKILKGGDYDLQVSLMEALCRMASPAQRNQLADSWFTMTFVSSAFKKIKDSEFETDCRKFLNMVNGMQGDGRSVYSYPCLKAFLDKHELLIPEDRNLEAFWIDFNLGSQSISFYFCLANKKAEDGQWSTLCIAENEVQSYTVKEESGRKVLHLVLTETVCCDNIEGSRVTIKFCSSLDILRATESVYGHAKYRTSVRKSSIVKTTVHINLSSQESSQVFVPESQVSPSLRVEGKGSSSVKHSIPCQPPTHPTPDTNNVPLQTVTPIKMKVSESCTYISGSVGSKQGSCSSVCVLPSVSKLLVKPALQMMSSSERKKETELRELMMSKTSSSVCAPSFQCQNNQKKAHAIQAQLTSAAHNEDQQKIQGIKAKEKKFHKHIPVDKVVQMVQADHEEDTFDNSVVPDSQPVKRGSSFSSAIWSLSSSKRRISVSRSLLALEKDCSKKRTISGELTDVRLRQLDIEFMKHLSRVVNIIPVIAKSDTLTLDEKTEFKQRVRKELEACGIECYPQKEFDEDMEDKSDNDKIREAMPFAVVGSDKEYQVNGKRVLGRKTAWGVVEVENPNHCEFSLLRDFMIRSHLQDLKEVTHNIHYETYRAKRLNDNGGLHPISSSGQDTQESNL